MIVTFVAFVLCWLLLQLPLTQAARNVAVGVMLCGWAVYLVWGVLGLVRHRG